MLVAVCVALCVAGWAIPGSSQPGWLDTPGDGSNPEHLAKVAQRLDMLRMWMLIDKLEVREDQAAELFPMWSRHRRHRHELKAERSRLANQLEKVLEDSSIPESQLLKQMAGVEAVDQRLVEAERTFQQELGQVLEARQRARLLLFPDQFRGDLTEMIRGLRGMPSLRGMQSGRGWPGGRGPARD